VWLVLCHADDGAAVWAYRGLLARGLAPLELVTAEALAFALRWVHRVDSAGAAFEVTLADGRRIASGEVRGTLNRIRYVPAPHWRSAAGADRDYAQQELFAFFTSALHALPGPVLNPASATGLSGCPRFPEEWAAAAARAGLAAPPRRRRTASPDAPVVPEGPGAPPARRVLAFVAGQTVIGAPEPAAAACRALARQTGTPLLGIELDLDPAAGWRFHAATDFPDLPRGGPALLDALALALRAEGA
jgi:hypothetical protein